MKALVRFLFTALCFAPVMCSVQYDCALVRVLQETQYEGIWKVSRLNW